MLSYRLKSLKSKKMRRTTRAELSELIDDSHVQTLAKVIAYVHRMEDQLGRRRTHEEQIKWALQEQKRFPSKRSRGDVRKHYYHPIYANHFGQYQIDLLVQSKDRNKNKHPHYFFIAINTNTRYAFALPLARKKIPDMLMALNRLIEAVPVRGLVSDQEPALMSAEVGQWAEEHEITYHFIPNQNHSALCIVDRFIRTLRDMNTPSYRSMKNSDDPDFRDFTVERMAQLVELYNNHLHSSIGMAPIDMQGSRESEEQYIVKKLYETHRRQRIEDYDLPMGTWAQFIVPHEPNEKHRYQVTPEVYQVRAKAGNHYVIMAKDGATRTIPRWRLLPVPDEEVRSHLRVASTIGDGNTGMVKKIVAHYPRRARRAKDVETYDVEWVTPDGEPTIETRETVAYLRSFQPQKGLTDEEREYWSK
jgi:hypothetical protein